MKCENCGCETDRRTNGLCEECLILSMAIDYQLIKNDEVAK